MYETTNVKELDNSVLSSLLVCQQIQVFYVTRIAYVVGVALLIWNSAWWKDHMCSKGTPLALSGWSHERIKIVWSTSIARKTEIVAASGAVVSCRSALAATSEDDTRLRSAPGYSFGGVAVFSPCQVFFGWQRVAPVESRQPTCAAVIIARRKAMRICNYWDWGKWRRQYYLTSIGWYFSSTHTWAPGWKLWSNPNWLYLAMAAFFASLPSWWHCSDFARNLFFMVKTTIWPLVVRSDDCNACTSFPFWRRHFWRTLLLVFVLSRDDGHSWSMLYFVNCCFHCLHFFFSLRLGIALVLQLFSNQLTILSILPAMPGGHKWTGNWLFSTSVYAAYCIASVLEKVGEGDTELNLSGYSRRPSSSASRRTYKPKFTDNNCDTTHDNPPKPVQPEDKTDHS